jgi:hypothetical protein
LEIKQEPSANTFFLRLEEGSQSEVKRLLASLGTLEDLPADGAMRLRVGVGLSDPRVAWQEVQALLGERANVQPVLLDESGHEQYPTGDISVRFLYATSDQQLKRFAETYGLRLRKRNEFVPEQAVFIPLEPGRHFLPDLVRKIASDGSVQAAWANTLARYQRF